MNLSLDINWLSVFLGTLSYFAIGAIWFGPKTFYPVWIRSMGREVPTERVEMSGAETALMFGGTLIGAFIQVLSLELVLKFVAGQSAGFGAVPGAMIGFFVAVGFGAFASLSHRMFGQADYKIFKSLKVWLIEVGADVVALTVAGAILGAML